MKANGQVYTPYSCIAFDINSNGTSATDIEHIVALAEAHDSGIADDRRRAFAADLDNLTIADPTVNRSQKRAHDAAEWMPDRHQAWFAQRVIEVKQEYGLTVDPAERDALEELLAGGGAELDCVNAGNADGDNSTPDHPPVKQYRVCADMRAAGWTRGVNRAGGTYRDSWDAAERETYSLNQTRDGDRDGHACE